MYSNGGSYRPAVLSINMLVSAKVYLKEDFSVIWNLLELYLYINVHSACIKVAVAAKVLIYIEGAIDSPGKKLLFSRHC